MSHDRTLHDKARAAICITELSDRNYELNTNWRFLPGVPSVKNENIHESIKILFHEHGAQGNFLLYIYIFHLVLNYYCLR